MNDVMRWEKYQCETGFCTLGLGKKKRHLKDSWNRTKLFFFSVFTLKYGESRESLCSIWAVNLAETVVKGNPQELSFRPEKHFSKRNSQILRNRK